MFMTSATVVMAFATVCLAFFAYQSNKLAKEIKRSNDLKEKEDKEFRQQTNDLYSAIVIATLVSGGVDTGKYTIAKTVFTELYKGKTPIFQE
ncbi:MAG TPA: hypothetical protein VMD04_05770 [Candidatus Margulisiibacteriota bacterium]|nr:hypothetical protein [Candidatus Margulisiibacteriota bacterium]